MDSPKQCQRSSESLGEALKHEEILPVLTAGTEKAKGGTLPTESINSHSGSFIVITMGSLGS